MKPNQAETEKDPRKQLKQFEQQPDKAKELELMKDHAEKSIGPEKVDSDKKDKGRKPDKWTKPARDRPPDSG